MYRLDDLTVGTEIEGRTRPITLARAGWYSIALFTAASGKPHEIQQNIHTNAEIAKSQGLDGPIADGMHSTNWISTLLTEVFGLHYLANGSLQTKYIRPIPIGLPITPRAVVTGIDTGDQDTTMYALDVWCDDLKHQRLTVGTATVGVTR